MSNKEFLQRMAEKRRLAILIFLHEEPDLRMGIHLLSIALESYILKPVNHDLLMQDAEILRKTGLITLEHIGNLPALTLTTLGREVVNGSRCVDGVQRLPLD